jgi:hypothetical protein
MPDGDAGWGLVATATYAKKQRTASPVLRACMHVLGGRGGEKEEEGRRRRRGGRA